MTTKKPVPVAVAQLIDKLDNPAENVWMRANVCATLENIREMCDEAINRFKTQKDKLLASQPVRRKA